MLQNLQSLFGTCCIGEAMPGANEVELLTALAEALPLRAAIEKAPAAVLGQDEKYENKPEPGLDATPNFTPGPRR